MSIDLRDSSSGSGRTILVAIICLLGQLIIAPNVTIFQGRVNFALVFTACLAMSEGGNAAVLGGFISGLIFDLCGTGPLGLMSLELTIAGYLVGLSGRNRFAEDRSDLARDYLFLAVGTQLAYQTALLILGQSTSLLDSFLYRGLPSLFLDILAFLPFAFWFSRQVVAGSSLGFGNKKTHHGRFDTPGK